VSNPGYGPGPHPHGHQPTGPYPVGPYPAGPYPVGPYAHVPQVVTDQRDVNGAIMAIAWFVAFFTAFYMLPWAIAATRGKANHGAIAVVNLFLGWSIIGWIVALIMACGSHRPIPATHHTYVMNYPR